MAEDSPQPIAIVGMSCRLPGGVTTPGELYRMLCRKRSGWSEVPADRLTAEAYHHPNPDRNGCFNSRGGYFVNTDFSSFDAAFFDITKKEAESMDPALRLLLECSYEALENGGYPKEKMSGRRVGVFVGANYGEHRISNLRDLDAVPTFDATGNQTAFLAGRLSYYFDLRGPTLTVDTACSSSLHAMHLAVNSIRSGESEEAIVAAAQLIAGPDIWTSMGKLRLFSNEGKTYAFDHRARSGYARGEGAGCLVLKPLARAQADNDHIFAVVTQTGLSHNGRTVGIVAPSATEQARLLTDVLSAAGIEPWEIGFFEAHGTGTRKGDPIEAEAIHDAVGHGFSQREPLRIGSVKTNVGHLECASGVVSVIKAALMLYYGFVLPNANFQRANRSIPLDWFNLKVATEQKPWPAKRKYVCVNNFGFSGSNSMCVLRAAPQVRGLEVAASHSYSPVRLFVLSANDEAALRNAVNRLGVWIEQHAELYQTTMPRNLSYTLCQRRSHLPWRVAVVAAMCSQVATELNSPDAVLSRAPSEPPRLAFVYTGQGAQWWAMGRELLRTHPVFRHAMRRADEVVRSQGAEFSVLDELMRDKATSRLGLAHISQPLCTAVQLALTDLLAAFGVLPSAVTGHSSGEIAAAYAAGALDFESAMLAAYLRGNVVMRLKRYPYLRGAMLAVGAGAAELESMLEEVNWDRESKIVVACENSPSSSTLSGDEDGISQSEEILQAKGVFNRRLLVDVAYHSPHMRLIANSYRHSLEFLEPPSAGESTSHVKFFSSLRNRLVELSELDAQYWVENLTQPVRFATALRLLCEEYKPDVLVEVGPHAALKGPILQTLQTLGPRATKISYLPTLVRDRDATLACLDTAGQLFVRGQPLDFWEINHHREENEKPEVVPSLYTYPWSRKQYWQESRLSRQHRFKPFERHDLLGNMTDWCSGFEPAWRNIIRTADLPWLKKYQIHSRTIFPAACFVSMIVEAACQAAHLSNADAREVDIRDVDFGQTLYVMDNRDYELVLTFYPDRKAFGQTYSFRVCSFESSRAWMEHCTGSVTVRPRVPQTDRESLWAELDKDVKLSWSVESVAQEWFLDLIGLPRNSFLRPAAFSTRTANHVVKPQVYEQFARSGMSYPETHRGIKTLATKEAEAIALYKLLDTAEYMPLKYEARHELHPSIIDAVFEVPVFSFCLDRDQDTGAAYIPSSIRHMTLCRDLRPQPGHAVLVQSTPTAVSGVVVSESHPAPWGGVKAYITMHGLDFEAVQAPPKDVPAPRELCYKYEWVPLDETASDDAESPVMEDEWQPAEACQEFQSRDTWAAGMMNSVEAAKGPVPYMEDIEDFSRPFIVWSLQPESMLAKISDKMFAKVKALLIESRSVLWVTAGATLPAAPTGSMILGLLRTARSERRALAAFVDLDPSSTLGYDGQMALVREAFNRSKSSYDSETPEMEFVEQDGRLVVPRIVPDEALNTEVHRSLGFAGPYWQSFNQPGRRLSLVCPDNHDNVSDHDLYFEDNQEEPLADDEVEVAVAACCLSPDEPTLSCSGVVSGTGRGVRDIWEGQAVCALARGPFGTHARAPRTSVAVLSSPTPVTMQNAAIIPGMGTAAYYALTHVARIRRNDNVLIDMSGPTGAAAIAMASTLGARPYALVRTPAQREAALRARLPHARILDADSAHLARDVEKVTGGDGMQAVLASSGDKTGKGWQSLAEFGRYVEIQVGTSRTATPLDLGPATTAFMSINMSTIAEEWPRFMREIISRTLRYAERGDLDLSTAAELLPLSDLAHGIRMVRNGHPRPVVVTTESSGSQEAQIKALHPMWGSIFRGESGTHLIIGTGGLAISVCRYMITHGARNVVLVSRSGGCRAPDTELRSLAQEVGAHLRMVQCDVSRESHVRGLVRYCQRTLPPICGVLHAAMVLRDVLLENMTADDYRDVISPKVKAAWALHKVLSEEKGIELDYFVALSSAAGAIGSRGQGAYAAANVFLDSLMAYRDSHGLPGTSLDLTAVKGAGYLEQNEARQEEIIRNFGHETVSESEVLALVSAAVRGMCGAECLTGMKLHFGADGGWPYYAHDARFVHLRAACLANAEQEGFVRKHTASPGLAFRAAKSDEEAINIAAQAVMAKFSEVLAISAENLDVARNITSYGLDSLTAIELRNWIAKELRANLQILELLSSGTISDLAALVVQKARMH